MKGTMDYRITVKQNQQRLFHIPIIAEGGDEGTGEYLAFFGLLGNLFFFLVALTHIFVDFDASGG